MSIAVERRDYLKHFDCFVCNQIEAGIFFAEDYEGKTPQELCEIISANVVSAQIPSIVVTVKAPCMQTVREIKVFIRRAR